MTMIISGYCHRCILHCSY